MGRNDPELAARLVIQTLPAAAAKIPGSLRFGMCVAGIGEYTVAVDSGHATVSEGLEGGTDFNLSTDARGLAELAGGGSPIRLIVSGRVRIRGNRLRARKLRAMSTGEIDLADVLANGGNVDPDLLYRSLPYLVDPAWTRGHNYLLRYEIGEGSWDIEVRDGEPIQVSTTGNGRTPDAVVSVSPDTFRKLVKRELSPTDAMRLQLTSIEGLIYPVTLLGRWMDRAQGRDDEELAREERQRALQSARAGSWGSSANGAAASPGQGDPAHESEGKRRAGGDLLTYGQLYALWEKQNWKAHELDFSVDQEQWVTTPAESQAHTAWSLGSFYIGEERVTADLAPFLLAAPSGEVEMFLATQLVDEARHTAFFDRFGAEVMALSADDLRGRMRELEATMVPAWHDTFDGGLREVAQRIQAAPDDLDLFVEGIATYHLIIEGVLAMTGQRLILQYMEDHGLYPGFQKGFSMVERDEHRHIAFGVRFLKDVMAEDAERFRPIIERRVRELVPKAVRVFVPPYADSAESFVSYGYDSTQIYGYAYRALKRRLAVIGLDCPPADELMPGPIAEGDAVQAVGAAA
ncbi:MAG TPA: ribonucleotide-diphosphate reductase subunit beta [Thermoleophilaceae bacterium]|nr:ribonucleotide-diphosphate reductase subunit beta [Thermoleophilaceae bacterium]